MKLQISILFLLEPSKFFFRNLYSVRLPHVNFIIFFLYEQSKLTECAIIKSKNFFLQQINSENNTGKTTWPKFSYLLDADFLFLCITCLLSYDNDNTYRKRKRHLSKLKIIYFKFYEWILIFVHINVYKLYSFQLQYVLMLYII